MLGFIITFFVPLQYKKIDSDHQKLRKRIFEIINYINNVSH